MRDMFVGVSSGGGANSGLFHLANGVAYGDSLEVGPDGTVVLEIGSDLAATNTDDPSAIAPPPALPTQGRLAIDQVHFDGVLEARFSGEFGTQFGDTYDLIRADTITGDIDLQITGLSPSTAARLQVIRASNLLQLRFIP